MTLTQRAKAELENRIIPFWSALRDEEHGGFYGYMDFDLDVDKKAEKGCILNSGGAAKRLCVPHPARRPAQCGLREAALRAH